MSNRLLPTPVPRPNTRTPHYVPPPPPPLCTQTAPLCQPALPVEGAMVYFTLVRELGLRQQQQQQAPRLEDVHGLYAEAFASAGAAANPDIARLLQVGGWGWGWVRG